jgi:nucleotide-binding universal stress UspA family protein
MTGPILIAYDGSEDAANAIACAGRLLAPRQALVVHSFLGFSRLLLRSDPPAFSGPLKEAVDQLRADDREEAERVVTEGAQLARDAGFEAQPVVVEQDGKPWQTIIATTEKHGADAIVAGARGRSAMASALLGSVSNGLAHHSPVPVLVVPATADPEECGGPPLLCYDSSPNSAQAIERAGELLAGRAALVLNVWESWVAHAPTYVPVVSGAVGGMARELDEIAETQSGELADAGVEQAAEAGFDPHAVSARCDGALWHGVLGAAEEHNVSAIVLGSRGLSGISAVLGSVSHGVVHHSQRAVLIVPPAAEQ